MRGAILEKGEKGYTLLRAIFSSIKDVQRNYNWLITDCVCYPNDKSFADLLGRKYCLLSGDELTNMVEKEDFQWVWAVLSGFGKDVLLKEVLKYELPYANGYGEFWTNPVTIQHPLAEIEIVAWDSTSTLLISKNCAIVDDFRKAFPLSEDLEEYNNAPHSCAPL